MVVREIAAESHLLDLCGLASYHVILLYLPLTPRHFIIFTLSLVPRPKEEEEEKGSGFSRSRMRLIISDLTTC